LASAPLFFVVTLGVGMLLSGDSFAAGAVVAAVATVVWVGLMTLCCNAGRAEPRATTVPVPHGFDTPARR